MCLVFDLSCSRQKTDHKSTLVNQVLFDSTVIVYLCSSNSPCIRWARLDFTVSDVKMMDSSL